MKVLDCKHCKKGPSLFKDYYEGYYLTCGDCGRSTLTYENLTRCKEDWNKMHERKVGQKEREQHHHKELEEKKFK